MNRHHPDDVHALVINRILALPKFSPESHEAHRLYQATRLRVVRPLLICQKAALERALASHSLEELSRHDAAVNALDDQIADAWLDVDSRIGAPLATVAA